jgi:hypothetical protein
MLRVEEVLSPVVLHSQESKAELPALKNTCLSLTKEINDKPSLLM